jgi:hypothetical protein
MSEDVNKIPLPASPLDYGEQDENGVDLSVIRRNLRLSPVERVRRAEKQSKGLLQLRRHAGRDRKKRT